MSINWSKVTNSHANYFRSRNLPYVEADIAGWHYWAFYCPVSTAFNEKDQKYSVEGVFFVREPLAQSQGGTAINSAFHVPGQWLSDANGTIFRLLHDQIHRD